MVPKRVWLLHGDGNWQVQSSDRQPWVCCFLTKQINFALVLAPKGVYRNWVAKEIPEHMSDDIPHRVIRWVASANKKQTEEMRSVKDNFAGLTIFVMNVESFSTKKGQTAGEWMARTFGNYG